ncbi:MAG: hypothetical protein ACJ74J_14820 [Blastocatellia bacterium]
MSRLDDELKVALQRQEPSPDFAARVLARINDAPAVQVKPSLWQRLSGIFAMPAWRYAAVGAMAVLLILIGIALLRSHRTATVGNESSPVAISHGESTGDQTNDGSKAMQEKTESKAELSAADRGAQAQTGPQVNTGQRPRAARGYQSVAHHAPVVAQQQTPSAEAEAAKEKVLSALQITSETLNDVQRAISDDRTREENPEPVQNR